MESLVVDNDLAFHSMHLERACLRHGIDMQYAKVKIPWYKELGGAFPENAQS